MFKEEVLSTALTTQAADSALNNIPGIVYRSDVSFTATLRAILYGRMEDGKYFNSGLTSRGVSSSWSDYSVREICESQIGYYFNESENAMFIVDLRGTADDVEKVLSKLSKNFEATYAGYSEMKDISALITKSFKSGVRVFVNAEKKVTVIFIHGLNMQKWHCLQAMLIATMPWYAAVKSVKDDPLLSNILMALYDPAHKEPGPYIEAVEKFAEQFDFEEQRLRNLLKDFDGKADLRKESSLQNSISSLYNSVDSYWRSAQECLDQIREQELVLSGVRERIAAKEYGTETLNYFLAHKNVDLVNLDDRSMEIIVRTYVTNVDRGGFKTTIKNRHSVIYNNIDSRFAADDVEKLMTEVFVSKKPRVKLRNCAAFIIPVANVRGDYSGYGRQGYMYPENCSNWLPNQHIQEYGCMPNYTMQITTCLKDGNMLAAIENCVAAAANLNYGDSTVMSKTIKKLFGRSKASYFELSDGRVVDAAEAIEWLKVQDGEVKKDEEVKKTEEEVAVHE